MKKNNIDIFIIDTTLLEIFKEISDQINLYSKNNILKIKSIDKYEKNNTNDIIIIDSLALEYLKKLNTSFKKYIFIINLEDKYINYLEKNKIFYENIKTPFNFLNLFKKLENLNNQNFISNKSIIKLKKFDYSHQLQTIYYNEKFLRLTDKENDIFSLLLDKKSEPIEKSKLLMKVWNYDEGIDTHTLETHIYTLRQKIDINFKIFNLILHDDNGYFINSDYL